MPRASLSIPALVLLLLRAVAAQDYCCQGHGGRCGPTGLEGPAPFNTFCSFCCGMDPDSRMPHSPQPNSCLR